MRKEDISLSFCERLADLRNATGKTQTEIGADIGISQAMLSNYESGKNEPTISILCELAAYYDVTTDYLLCRSNEPAPSQPFTDKYTFGALLELANELDDANREALLKYLRYLRQSENE